MNKNYLVLAVMIAAICLLVGCSSAAKVRVSALTAEPKEVTLSVSGKQAQLVDNDNWEKVGLSLDESKIVYKDAAGEKVNDIKDAVKAEITIGGKTAEVAVGK